MAYPLRAQNNEEAGETVEIIYKRETVKRVSYMLRRRKGDERSNNKRNMQDLERISCHLDV